MSTEPGDMAAKLNAVIDERRAPLYLEMLAALTSVHRVCDTALLPGPVYMSIAERDAIRAVLAKCEELEKEA